MQAPEYRVEECISKMLLLFILLLKWEKLIIPKLILSCLSLILLLSRLILFLRTPLLPSLRYKSNNETDETMYVFFLFPVLLKIMEQNQKSFNVNGENINDIFECEIKIITLLI